MCVWEGVGGVGRGIGAWSLGINEILKTGLCPECGATTTKLENIIVNLHEENVPMRSSMARC